MGGEGFGRIDTRMSGAYVHELADGTPTPRFRPYYITFYWLSSPWREQKERCERRARLEARKKSLHRESALIKAPFYTFRWHRGITSVSRYFFFFFPSPIPFAPFFFPPSRFALFVSLFFLFSFVYLLFSAPFFLFFPWDTRDMKLRESERGGGGGETR